MAEANSYFTRQFASLLEDDPTSEDWRDLGHRNMPANVKFNHSGTVKVDGRWRVVTSGDADQFGWGGRYLEIYIDGETESSWKALAFTETADPDTMHSAYALLVCKSSKPIHTRLELSARNSENKKVVLGSRKFSVSTSATPLFVRTDLSGRTFPTGLTHLRLNLFLETRPKFGFKILDLRFVAY